MRTSVRGVVALGAAAVLLAGCSDGDDGGEGGAEKVTLTSLMGVPSDDDFDFGSAVEQIEAGVEACMANEGWNYYPVMLPTAFSSYGDSDEDEVERIKREGLGISYYYLLDPSSEEAQVIDPLVDHNEDYVATLTEAEKEAYDASLYGTEEEKAADTITVFDLITGEESTTTLGSVGCRGEARDAFYGDDPSHNPLYQEAMQAYWDELADRTEADPRFITLNEEWSLCMTKAGYDYLSPDQYADAAYGEFTLRTDEVVGPDLSVDPMASWSQEEITAFWSSATDEEVAALYSNPVELTADQRSQLEAIFAEEVAVELAAHECSKDYDTKAQETAADVEEQYALEHEDELRELAATIFDGS